MQPKDEMFEEPVALVVFGGAGDLARRKLLPALYNLFLDGLLPPRFAVVGVGRKSFDDDAYRASTKDGLARFSRRPIEEATWTAFAQSLYFVSGSLADSATFAALGARLDII